MANFDQALEDMVPENLLLEPADADATETCAAMPDAGLRLRSSGNESACSRSFNNKEDYPIRIYSALKINADYTITRNRKDFYLYLWL